MSGLALPIAHTAASDCRSVESGGKPPASASNRKLLVRNALSEMGTRSAVSGTGRVDDAVCDCEAVSVAASVKDAVACDCVAESESDGVGCSDDEADSELEMEEENEGVSESDSDREYDCESESEVDEEALSLRVPEAVCELLSVSVSEREIDRDLDFVPVTGSDSVGSCEIESVSLIFDSETVEEDD
jgi:hypothetical protein